MRNILVTIVGHDRPGIIHQVSKALADYRCHVIEVSQTTLMGEFAGLFSCRISDRADPGEFNAALGKVLEGSGLAHWVTGGEGAPEPAAPLDLEPYVVTVRGPDRLGIIPEFSGIMSGFDANIDNLRAVGLEGDPGTGGERPKTEGADENRQVVMFFEISVPRDVNQNAFRQALNLVAEDLGLEMSLQHRDIFEAIHRL